MADVEKERELALRTRDEEYEAELAEMEDRDAKKNELERAEKARNKDFEDIRARTDTELEFLKTVWDTFRGLAPKQLVDDERVWRELQDRYEEYFAGGMGAEAIKDLISRIDMEFEEENLKEIIATAKGQRKAKGIKRLKVISAFNRVDLTGQSPRAAWMSVWHSPLASILTSTCPGPGRGTGTSRISSGAPSWGTTAAFMTAPSVGSVSLPSHRRRPSGVQAPRSRSPGSKVPRSPCLRPGCRRDRIRALGGRRWFAAASRRHRSHMTYEVFASTWTLTQRCHRCSRHDRGGRGGWGDPSSARTGLETFSIALPPARIRPRPKPRGSIPPTESVSALDTRCRRGPGPRRWSRSARLPAAVTLEEMPRSMLRDIT